MTPNLRSAFLAALLTLLVGCGGGIPVDQEGVFQAKRTLYPDQFEMEGVELRNMRVQVEDGIALDAWYFQRPEAECTVVYFGGQGHHMVTSRDFIEGFLEGTSAELFMIDYRGYGQSDGKPTVDALKSDALAVYDKVVSLDGERCVIAHGHSMGAFMATWLAENKPVDGVVLENPPVSVESWTGALVPWYLDLFISFDIDPALKDEDNLARVRKLQAPLLVIAGGEDKITPPEQARTLFEAAASEPKWLEVIEAGGHNDLSEHTSYFEAYGKLIDHLRRDQQTTR